MEFRGMETLVVEVLRTPELQRLRKVKQLGLVHYVFPSAEHSRFSHCLGAAHLAIRFGRQVQEEARRIFVTGLVPEEDAVADFALAALCHDLGHGPLSHAWEREIVGDDFDRVAWATALGLDVNDSIVRDAKWHEMVGHGLLSWPEGQLHRLLKLHETDRPERIRQFLSKRYYYPYLPRLLNSDVDVDRADFIMRDTHNTGVAYGRYDLDWLISTCTLGKSEDTNEWVVGFDTHKAVRVIEQFLIARQAMYDTVYHHKTVRCIEGMVALLLKRLKDVVAGGSAPASPDLISPMIKILRRETLEPHEFLRLDDFALFVLIDTVAQGLFKDDTAQDLATRIQSRDLFKMVPVDDERIASFVTSVENMEKLHTLVQRHVPGHAKYYVAIDRARFEMLSRNRAQHVMLVDHDRMATRAAEHDMLTSYRQPEHIRTRIFTVGPAIESVRRLILGN